MLRQLRALHAISMVIKYPSLKRFCNDIIQRLTAVLWVNNESCINETLLASCWLLWGTLCECVANSLTDIYSLILTHLHLRPEHTDSDMCPNRSSNYYLCQPTHQWQLGKYQQEFFLQQKTCFPLWIWVQIVAFINVLLILNNNIQCLGKVKVTFKIHFFRR